MKNIILLLLMTATAVFALNPFYHDYSDIKRELDSLKVLYPQFVQVESIGVSLNDHTPIWAVKLSDNAAVDEDEPAALFVGQLHAEEVLGIEITMSMIKKILQYRNVQPYKIWLQELEIWFVPTGNPEGLSVVTSGFDESFRKNKRDNNNNGILDFANQPGGDLDGVDLNRNFAFNWIHGDSLYCTNGEETFDYYRGPAAFSEGETQAIKNLAAKQHFIYSIVWHSSRTGNLSEKVFYSFDFANGKQSPDFAFNKYIGESVAGLIATESGSAFYEPSPSRGRNGSAHDWFYQTHGTTQLLIECGTANLQPNQSIMESTCNRNMTGAFWLLNRMLGYQTDGAMLTGIVKRTDVMTPLSAEIIVLEKQASYLAPRTSDAKYGRYYRQLAAGLYTVKFRQKGFISQTISNVLVNNSAPTELNVNLAPLPTAQIAFTITKNGQPINAELQIEGEYPECVQIVNGFKQLNYFAGELKFTVTADGCSPVIATKMITPGNNSIAMDLFSEDVLFSEDFSSGLAKWNADANWQLKNNNGRTIIDDSPGLFYADNSQTSIKTIAPITIPTTGGILELVHNYYVEHDFDKCLVLVALDNQNWDTLKVYSGISEGWQQNLISLDNYKDKNVYLKLTMTADANLNDPGWQLDRVRVYKDQGVGIGDEPTPATSTLCQNYPNPFNNSTVVNYQLGTDETINLAIYNVKGEVVKTLFNGKQSAGKHAITFNANGLNSGVYFCQLTGGNGINACKKLLLIK